MSKSRTQAEHFVWHRPVDGYEWVGARSVQGMIDAGRATDSKKAKAEGRYLVEKPSATPLHYTSNPTARHPTLYQAFAELDPTEESFAAFADSYGWLGIETMIVRQPGVYQPSQLGGEEFNAWMYAHLRMLRVVDVLKAIQARDIGALRQWFSFGPTSVSYHRDDEGRGFTTGIVAARDLKRSDSLWEFATAARSKEESAIRFARGWAQKEINEAMFGERNGPRSTTAARILNDPQRGTMGVYIVPSNLLAAMWLQCARALTVNPTFKACDYCGNWIEVTSKSRKNQSRYCSARCKVAASRANQFSWMAPSYRAASKHQQWPTLSEEGRVSLLIDQIRKDFGIHRNDSIADLTTHKRWHRVLGLLEETTTKISPASEIELPS